MSRIVSRLRVVHESVWCGVCVGGRGWVCLLFVCGGDGGGGGGGGGGGMGENFPRLS